MNQVEIDDVVGRHHTALRRVAIDADSVALGPYSSIAQPENFLMVGGKPQPTRARNELHKELIQQVLDTRPAAAERRHAVVMAGPPGAGKGYVQREALGGLMDHVVGDPDMFKELLLDHELRSGGLAALTTPLMREYMAAGERFAPMEFASLVHEESSMLAKQLQRDMLQQGTNFVFDTVLRSEDSAQAIGTALERRGYSFEVVSVQTTQEMSEASIHSRWEEPYRAFLAGENQLGGRPVPSEFARSVFPAGGGPSLPEQHAQRLAESAPGCVRYRVYRRTDADTGHKLEVDKSRLKFGAPLLSVAEAKAQSAAIFGRAQNGPSRRTGLGPQVQGGAQQSPKKPRGVDPHL